MVFSDHVTSGCGLSGSSGVSWRQVAWDGIRFDAPGDWDIKEIGFKYLVMESAGVPVLEIKWRRIAGVFNLQRQINRMIGRFGSKTFETRRVCPLPAGWIEALEPFEATGFFWRGSTGQGKAVLLFCPVCRNAVLLHFIETGRSISADVIITVLRSFRDHAETEKAIWCIFDIRAELPVRFALKRYRFEPGMFELSFDSTTEKITLHRFAPASVLLSGKDLPGFVRETMPAEDRLGELQMVRQAPWPAVEWQTACVGRQARPRFWPFGKSPCRWFRWWHVVEKNRILGIRIEAKKPIEPVLLENIRYETL